MNQSPKTQQGWPGRMESWLPMPHLHCRWETPKDSLPWVMCLRGHVTHWWKFWRTFCFQRKEKKTQAVPGSSSLTQDLTFPRRDKNKLYFRKFHFRKFLSVSRYCSPSTFYSYSWELQARKNERTGSKLGHLQNCPEGAWIDNFVYYWAVIWKWLRWWD